MAAGVAYPRRPPLGPSRDCPPGAVLLSAAMPSNDPFDPEISYVTSPRVACDGASEISPALGHPRVYLQIDERGFAECGYCDKRFVLIGGPMDQGRGEA